MSDLAGAKATVTLHWMKGRRSTKIGIRVRTIKSRKSHRASPPTFRSAISLTCRLSQYHWLSSWRSKQTRITFRATGEHTPANGSQRCYRCPLQALREEWGAAVGTSLHRHALMHVHMHTRTPKAQLSFLSVSECCREGGQLSYNKGLRIRTESPMSREIFLLHT